jgi:hypothetical protein
MAPRFLTLLTDRNLPKMLRPLVRTTGHFFIAANDPA